MENEKILEKIKKLFALADNNPSEEEAKSAALMAQKLMMENDIAMWEVEGVDLNKKEEITEEEVDVPAKKWKYTLAHIVADNFRVKFFLRGKGTFIFYGHTTDAKIATETFKYLFNVGDKLGKKLYYEAKIAYEETRNVYNSCVMGFCAGVRDALAEQSKALMVIIPEDVKEAYKERSAGFGTSHTSAPRAYNGDAFRTGKSAGYNAMKRNALEG